jgi:hypothetical protein
MAMDFSLQEKNTHNSARVVFSQLYKTPWHIEQNPLKNAASNATESDAEKRWD